MIHELTLKAEVEYDNISDSLRCKWESKIHDDALENKIRDKLETSCGVNESVRDFNNVLKSIEGINGAELNIKCNRKKEMLDKKNMLLLFEMTRCGKLPNTFNSKVIDSSVLRSVLNKRISDCGVINFFKYIEYSMQNNGVYDAVLLCELRNGLPTKWFWKCDGFAKNTVRMW